MKKNWAKSVLSVLLVCVIAFVVVGCGKTSADLELLTTSEPETEVDATEIRYNDLRLPYAKADSLDPFLAKSSMNRQLCSLMYDSLFVVGENFEAKPLIAKEYSADMNSITVSVNTDIRFSDQSYMTMEDIVYSFNLAKESNVFSARLKHFGSASVTGANVMVFTLDEPDPYAVGCLDFPIIKMGTSTADRKAAEKAAREEGEVVAKTADKIVPIGSGRYMLKYEENEADPVLVAFNDRFKGFYPTMATIHLVNITDPTALFYSLEIGNISFAFDDLSGGKYTRVNAKNAEYTMNNFVYLGMNQDDSALAVPAVRRAIATAIDKEDILNVAFQGHATITNTPFNPIWGPAAVYENNGKEKQKTAMEILKDAGFDQVNSYGIRNNGRLSLTFNLIVSEDNNFKIVTAQRIANKLKTLNIKVNIKTMPSDAFLDAVELGKFDMYVGEVNMTANMDLDPFFGGSGAMAHGIWNKTAADAYYSMLAGEINFDAFMEAFDQDTPFVPLCFRKGIVAGVKELSNAQDACYGDLYEDIESWHF